MVETLSVSGPDPELVKRVEAEKAAKQSDMKKLAEFLALGPLYSPFLFDPLARGLSLLPETIQLHCASPVCSKVQTFERVTYRNEPMSHRGWGNVATYKCRNCATKEQKYMYVWNNTEFWKVGQIPELLEAIEPKLNRALGDSKHLYKKAIRSRNFGFGIGAVCYLRRIIEDTTENLMALLREEKWEEWTPEEKEQFELAHGKYQYSQKIDYAAGKILPATVFANGRDSFSALHDVTSSGLHGKSEEECLEIFDRCNLIFTRSFRVLRQHKEEREAFAAQLLALKR